MVTTATALPFKIYPLSNIAPFTYKEASSHMELVEQLVNYVSGLDPVFQALLEEMVAKFNEALDGTTESFTSQFQGFVAEINTLVNAINNRVGPVSMRRHYITGDLTVNIDPTWPSAHWVNFQVTQGPAGGKKILMGAGISGEVDYYTLPGSMTEFSLIPNGDGTWHVHQPDSSLPGAFPDATTADLIIDPATDTSAALRRNYVPMVVLSGEGIDPTGVANSTVAIQAKLNEAGAMASPDRRVQVMLPPGSFRVTKQGTASALWGYCLTVPDNIEIVGPGQFIYDIVFGNAASVLLIQGDNVTIDGVNFYNNTAASPFSVSIAMGDIYDDDLDRHRIYKNLNIRNCNFINAWLAVSVQFEQPTNTSGLDGVRIHNCYTIGKSTQTSGAAYNYRSTPMGRIVNADMSTSRAVNGLSAAAFNYYGVIGGSITDVAAIGNDYAAVEIENGCEQITVNGVRSDDCARGVWIDDSQFITVNGVTVNNPASTNRDAISISYGGNPNDLSQLTGGISVRGVVSRYGKITITSFGTVNGGGFGSISISDVEIYLSSTNPTGLLFSNRNVDLQLTNVNIHGIRDRGFTGTINEPGIVYMTNCTTDGIANTDGLALFGGGTVIMQGCRFHTISGLPTSIIAPFGNFVNDVLYSENINYFRRYNGNGDPEGVVTAGPGAIYQRSGGGAGQHLYVKESGTGNTGWVAK